MRKNQIMSEDEVKYLILHCSATRCDREYTEEMLLRDHLARHFRGIGYHFYIRKDGWKSQHRMLLEAKIVGHRDLPDTIPKECPCCDAHALFGWIEKL